MYYYFCIMCEIHDRVSIALVLFLSPQVRQQITDRIHHQIEVARRHTMTAVTYKRELYVFLTQVNRRQFVSDALNLLVLCINLLCVRVLELL